MCLVCIASQNLLRKALQSNENITVVHQTLSIIVSLEHSDLIILFFVLRHPSQM